MRVSNRSMRTSRRGATTVEFAVVSLPLFMFLFGIFEYSRYLFTLQVMENAVREGARYAVVHTLDSTVEADTIARVREHIAGIDMGAFGVPATVTVYAAANDGTNTGGPRDAPFGTFIGVRVQGAYRPVTPGLLMLSDTIALDVRALMGSEAN